MFDTIIGLIIAAAPAISAVVGVFAAIKKVIANTADKSKEVIEELKVLKTEVKNSKEYDELKDQLKVVHLENIQLKKKLNELLNKIDRVNRKDEHDEGCECEKCQNKAM